MKAIKLNQDRVARSLVGALVIVLIAAVGVRMLTNSHAASTAFYTNNLTRQNAYNDISYWRNTILYIQDNWTGSISGCNAGSVSASFTQATLDTINYFRNMNQLPPVSFDSTDSSEAQQAALMMLANNQLNHLPPSSWLCYTAAGANAAGTSNLALDVNGPEAIFTYMNDDGSNNENVLGHRRWILSGRVQVMGSGDTSSSNALYLDTSPASPAPGVPEFVSWPSANYFPVEMAPSQWSITNADDSVNMSSAQVSLTINGTTTNESVIQLPEGYGDNGIAWNMPELDNGPPFPDTPVQITVSGLKNKYGASIPNYSYTTVLFDQFYATSPNAGSGSINSGGTSNSNSTSGGKTTKGSSTKQGSTPAANNSTTQNPTSTTPNTASNPSGNSITLPTDAGLTLWDGSNFGISGQNFINSTSSNASVGLANKSGTPLALVNIDLASPVDWSKTSLEFGSESITHRAFVHGLTTAPDVVGGTFTLYVPYADGDHYVGICPGASNLIVVNSNCPNLYYLESGQKKTHTNSSTIPPNDTVTTSVVTIAKAKYWAISGLSGTGGFSAASTASPHPLTKTKVGKSKLNYILFIVLLMVLLLLDITYNWWIRPIRRLVKKHNTSLPQPPFAPPTI